MLKVSVANLTLSEYLAEIRDYIQSISEYRWIVAEIAKVDCDKNGNYWIELIERNDDEIVAKCDAVVWSRNASTIANFFIKTGIQFNRGIKILFLGKAIFHEKYGFKISIYQIDPSFTVGEMALKKEETIRRLRAEGLIDKNKLIEIPAVIQRIAIISSESAAGYEDFLKILKGNKFGFKFHTKLFDAFVQGEYAVNSLIEAFQRCSSECKAFDVVVLIRGGGSVSDLAIFNEYELAKTMALMPIPVFTGIGHTRDETVADFVASISFKTPSEVAKFILDRALDFDSKIDALSQRIRHRVEKFLSVETSKSKTLEDRFKLALKNSRERLLQKMNLIVSEVHNNVLKRVHSERELIFKVKQQLYKKTNMIITAKHLEMTNINNKIKIKLSEKITKEIFKVKSSTETLFTKLKNILAMKKIQIERAGEKLQLLSPENILKRGYSVTYLNGRVLKNSQQVPIGANVEIKLYRGMLTAEVTRKEEDNGELKLF